MFAHEAPVRVTMTRVVSVVADLAPTQLAAVVVVEAVGYKALVGPHLDPPEESDIVRIVVVLMRAVSKLLFLEERGGYGYKAKTDSVSQPTSMETEGAKSEAKEAESEVEAHALLLSLGPWMPSSPCSFHPSTCRVVVVGPLADTPHVPGKHRRHPDSVWTAAEAAPTWAERDMPLTGQPQFWTLLQAMAMPVSDRGQVVPDKRYHGAGLCGMTTGFDAQFLLAWMASTTGNRLGLDSADNEQGTSPTPAAGVGAPVVDRLRRVLTRQASTCCKAAADLKPSSVTKFQRQQIVHLFFPDCQH